MESKSINITRIILVCTLSIAAIYGLFLGMDNMVLASQPIAPSAPSSAGPPPTTINYQGTIHVDGGIFDGTGYFKFAVVDSATGNGTTNYWSHDGTVSGEPTTYFTLTIDNSLFNVNLGDTSIISMTQPISHTDFSTTDTYLRVWFSDDGSTFQGLEPNQQFTSVAYALRTHYAEHADYAANYNEVDGSTSNELQNLFATITGDTGSTTADAQNDTLNIVGSGNASTAISGDTLTITVASGADNLGNHTATQNLDLATYKLVGNGSSTGVAIHNSGIVDLDNQSRARAFLTHIQVVPSSVWTPIEFNDDATSPGGYDQQGEFTLWTVTPTPAFFTATETGYYQIHARTEFEYGDPAQLNPSGFVSIAIFVNGVIYAQGNNLQMITPVGNVLWYNNASNVSDVVYLQTGDVVDIRAWQSLEAGPGVVWLFTGTEKTYVSIHKDS